jgi:signal-transduction protein with cAMP-binding, CBS, and nucleotidyltransferase domain
MSTIPHYLEKYFLSILVKDLEPRPTKLISASASIAEAAKLMNDIRVSLLFVELESGRDAIITEHDILKAVASHPTSYASELVGDYSSQPVEFISARASVARVMYMMTTSNFRHLPLKKVGGNDSPLYISTLSVVRFVYERLAKQTMKRSQEMKELENEIQELLALPISELKPSVPQTVGGDASILTVVQRMKSKGIGSMFIVEDNKLKGIFTERDLLVKVCAVKAQPADIIVRDVMTVNPTTISNGLSLAYAFEVMNIGGFRHIPVVDAIEELIGVLSVRNFISALSNEVFGSIQRGMSKDPAK